MSDPIQKFWNNIAKTEPYWSVLTHETHLINNIDKDAFYKTGSWTVENIFRYLSNIGFRSNIKTCLDFGCGVGRITLPLANKVDHVDALDISESMLEIAGDYLDANGITNVDLIDTNKEPDFLSRQGWLRYGQVGKYDLVYSALVLQHNPKPRAKKLLAQLCRSISDRGIGLIHIFSELSYTTDPESHAMQMHDIPLEEARKVIEYNGCKIISYDTNNLQPTKKPTNISQDKSGYLVIESQSNIEW